MAGRRVLDLAALLRASRGVVQKHVALRRQKLDTYSRTSTLAKALKSQTDRVTLTVQAASALSKRLNENRLTFSTPSQGSRPHTSLEAVPSGSSVEEVVNNVQKPKEGLEQDHFYAKSDQNSTKGPLPQKSLKVKQEQAQGAPLPDGTIPPACSELGRPTINTDTVSAIPRTESAKDLLSGEHTGSDNLEPIASSRNSLPRLATRSPPLSADQARKLQREAEDPIPSTAAEPPALVSAGAEQAEFAVDQDKDIYYSPSTNSKPVLSALPRVKVPKVTEDIQDGDQHVSAQQINQDVYYSSSQTHLEDSIPEKQAIPEQGEPSDEMYSELFQSPKVAKMLSGKRKSSNGSPQPHEQTTRPDLAQNFKDSKQRDSEASNTRITTNDDADNVELSRQDLNNQVARTTEDSVPDENGGSTPSGESTEENQSNIQSLNLKRVRNPA